MRKWAVVENEKPLQCIDCETPVPAGREVLIEVTHCGVCHSDLHLQKGYFDMGGGRMLRVTDRGVKLPCAPGHEIAGRVAGLGPDASGVAIGDRCVVYPWIGCGTCELCLTDRENLCYSPDSLGVIRDGGFGSHVVVPSSAYLFDHTGIDPAFAATLACSGLTVRAAIRKLGAPPGNAPILLIGAGGLGMVAIAMLRAMGHPNLFVLDNNRVKLDAARAAGAVHVFAADEPDLAGRITSAAGRPLLFAIDFVNNAQTVTIAFEALGKEGKLVLVGVGGGEFPLSLAGMIFRIRTIAGSITGSRQDLRDVIDLAREGKLNAVPIKTLPKDQANAALDALHEGRVTGRLVLEEAGA